MPKAAGPFKIIDQRGTNAFRIEMIAEYGDRTTFNIGDLAPYHGPQEGGTEPCLEHCSKAFQREPTSTDNLSNPSVMEENQTHTQGSDRAVFSTLAPNSHGEQGVSIDASQGWETEPGS